MTGRTDGGVARSSNTYPKPSLVSILQSQAISGSIALFDFR